LTSKGEVVTVGHRLRHETRPLANDRAHEKTAQHQLNTHRIAAIRQVRITFRRERNLCNSSRTGHPAGASMSISQLVHSLLVR
ncbi:hypothetical protein PFISCL1PPCAC_18135, partial [Pristionchus fissidentatus]